LQQVLAWQLRLLPQARMSLQVMMAQ